MGKKALIALHDVAPFNLSRLLEAEKFLKLWGITKINYLYVPHYHRHSEKLNEKEQRGFFEWIHRDRTWDADWILHGLYHERRADRRNREVNMSWLRGLIWTAREAEFLGLSKPEIQSRVQAGLEIFQKHLGFAPQVFVPPAWLFDKELIDVLEKMEFYFTEDHMAITALKSGKVYHAPVITWATRSHFRRVLSRVGCRILARRWSQSSLIRIAVHPPDFGYPSIIQSIQKIIQSVLADRELLLYKDLNVFLDDGDEEE